MSTLSKDNSSQAMAGMSPGKLRWAGEPEFPPSGYTRERADFPGPGCYNQPVPINTTSAILKTSSPRFADPRADIVNQPGPSTYTLP
eukprot:8245490-Pyramimonas_sp.AAC.2